jgi:hypothetical protein
VVGRDQFTGSAAEPELLESLAVVTVAATSVECCSAEPDSEGDGVSEGAVNDVDSVAECESEGVMGCGVAVPSAAPAMVFDDESGTSSTVLPPPPPPPLPLPPLVRRHSAVVALSPVPGARHTLVLRVRGGRVATRPRSSTQSASVASVATGFRLRGGKVSGAR